MSAEKTKDIEWLKSSETSETNKTTNDFQNKVDDITNLDQIKQELVEKHWLMLIEWWSDENILTLKKLLEINPKLNLRYIPKNKRNAELISNTLDFFFDNCMIIDDLNEFYLRTILWMEIINLLLENPILDLNKYFKNYGLEHRVSDIEYSKQMILIAEILEKIEELAEEEIWIEEYLDNIMKETDDLSISQKYYLILSALRYYNSVMIAELEVEEIISLQRSNINQSEGVIFGKDDMVYRQWPAIVFDLKDRITFIENTLSEETKNQSFTQDLIKHLLAWNEITDFNLDYHLHDSEEKDKQKAVKDISESVQSSFSTFWTAIYNNETSRWCILLSDINISKSEYSKYEVIDHEELHIKNCIFSFAENNSIHVSTIDEFLAFIKSWVSIENTVRTLKNQKTSTYWYLRKQYLEEWNNSSFSKETKSEYKKERLEQNRYIDNLARVLPIFMKLFPSNYENVMRAPEESWDYIIEYEKQKRKAI